MRDSGKLHVLEVVLVGALFFSSAGFVLTFDQPSTPDQQASETLQTRGEDALSTFYDRPLDDPRYGDNMMSKRLDQSLQGDDSELSDQLNNTMPPYTLYNLYISNGYAEQPLYEQYDLTDEPATTSTRLIEPEWSYVWTSTDFKKYPADPTTTPTKIGLYTLPVEDGTALRTGGAEVDVIVEGSQDHSAHKTANFRLDSSFTLRQAGSGDNIPHASLYFNSSSDEPIGYRDVTDEIDSGGLLDEASNITWYNVSLKETAGEPVEAGSQLTVTLPRGWKAQASDESGDYTVVQEKTDPDVRGSLVFELERDVQDETLNFGFNTTYTGDAYEFYTYRASLDKPNFGDARLIVRPEDQTGYTGGDYPHPRVSAPQSMGTSTYGTWVMAFPNPENAVGSDDLEVDKITIRQPEGTDLFSNVRTVRSPDVDCNTPGWSVKSPSKIVWDPGTSSCSISTGDGFQLAFEVKGDSSYSTNLNLDPPFHPDAGFSNGHNMSVDRAFAESFSRQFVPPDTQGTSIDHEYPGYPHPDTTATETVDTDSVYKTSLLKGNTSYSTGDINTYQSALALGSLDAEPRTAIGGSTTVDIQLESLLLGLSEKGLEASVRTNIYPPWAMGPQDPPIKTIDHVEENILEASIDWTYLQDLDDDGTKDVVAITPQTKIYGFDGDTGTQITGFEVTLADKTATSATEFDYDGSKTTYAIGFEDGTVKLYDEDFTKLWTATLGNGRVRALNASYDWNGDGVTDIVASSGSVTVFVDGASGSNHNLQKAPGTVANVEAGDLISTTDGGETVTSLGANVTFEGYGRTISGNGYTYNEEDDRIHEYKRNQDVEDALSDPTLYREEHSLVGWDTQEMKVWEGAHAGFHDLSVGDLDGNGIDDVVGGQTGDAPFGPRGDPGRVQALNGTTNATNMIGWAITYGNTIVDVAAPTRRHSYTISEDGIMMYTIDGWAKRHYYGWSPPKDWDIAQFPLANSVDFINASHGFVVGAGNSMSRTNSSGSSWSGQDYDVYDPTGLTTTLVDLTETTYEYMDMSWQNGDDGVVVGGDCTEASIGCQYGRILYTNNSGMDWYVAGAPHKQDLSGFKYHDVHFVDNSFGYAVGSDGRVAKTTDGGDDWSLVSGDPWPLLTGDLRPTIHAVYFHDRQTGYIAGEDMNIYRTTDGGDSWKTVEMQSYPGQSATTATIYDMDFSNRDKGYFVGSDGVVYVTYNGGKRWVAQAPPGPEDTVEGMEYRSVEIPPNSTKTGWAAGTTSDSNADRLLMYFPTYTGKATAVSEPLSDINDWHDNDGDGDSLAKVRAARVDPWAGVAPDTPIEYHLSNDGCSNWVKIPQENATIPDAYGIGNYEWKNFSDPSKTSLCFKARLTAEARSGYRFVSPWLVNLTVEYEYKESGDSEWHTRNHTFQLTDPAVRDEAATTATWNTTAGTVRLPYVDTFWTQRVHGTVKGVAAADVTGDGEKDVLAWTGKNTSDHDGDGTVEWDNKVYAFDGGTGEKIHETGYIPGEIAGVHPMSLPTATNDAIADFVVSYENEFSGEANLRAYDGDDFSRIWNQTDNRTVASFADGELDGDADEELVRGTKADSATEQPVISANEPDHSGSANWEWTTRPDFVGKYTFEYDVPRYALFGPYVVETKVGWDDTATSGVQSARLYDTFSVTTPNGSIPESPVYRLDLVSKYQG